MPEAQNSMLNMIKVILYASVYIAFSWSLITYNKFLMSPGVFPFAAGLGLLHTGASSVLAIVLYLVMPSMFPYLTEAQSSIDANLIFKAVLPIAVCFTVQIVLSNQAYLFADVAFLQMLKESNVVAVYFFSVLFAIEQFKWLYARTLLLIVLATWMTIKGELHCTLAALLLQGSSFIGESLKITLQGVLLSSAGTGRKMDPYSYLIIVMPACFAMFGIFLLFNSYALPPGQMLMPTPTWAHWKSNAPLLLGNACVAVGLNVSGTILVKATSAVSYVLSGILKDVLIVVTGILFMGHECGTLQGFGFLFQVLLVLTWSMIKTFPKQFEDGIIPGFSFVLFGEKQAPAAIVPPTYGAAQVPISDKSTNAPPEIKV